jgi:hypothetical protein
MGDFALWRLLGPLTEALLHPDLRAGLLLRGNGRPGLVSNCVIRGCISSCSSQLPRLRHEITLLQMMWLSCWRSDTAGLVPTHRARAAPDGSMTHHPKMGGVSGQRALSCDGAKLRLLFSEISFCFLRRFGIAPRARF